MSELIFDDNILTIDEDQLGRGPFIRSVSTYLTEQLTNKTEDEREVIAQSSVILGLYGQWGSGKTSILRCLDHELKESGAFKTVWLNPWVYNSQEQIVLHLLRLLVQSLQLEDPEKKNELKKLLANLVKGVSGVTKGIISLKTGSLANTIADPIIEAAEATIVDFLGEKELDIYDVKEKINEIFEETATPIVMFIDDVDRLSNDELIILFKTVRMLADFRKVCYILSFDVDAVAKSIKDQYGAGEVEDGYGYIEKIITLPIYVPEVPKLELLKYSLLRMPIEDVSDRYIKELFGKYVHTPRQAKRFINSYVFTYSNLKDIIPSNLLFVYELIKIYASKEYKILKDYLFHYLNNFNDSAHWADVLREYIKNKTGVGNLISRDEIGRQLAMLNDEIQMIAYCTNISLGMEMARQYGSASSDNNRPGVLEEKKRRMEFLRKYIEFESNLAGD